MRKFPIVICLLLAAPAFAGPATVVDAEAAERDGIWQFSVTLEHADTGWDHYADAWEIRTRDGTVLGTRKLLHPHENEQPFTRSLSGIEIPEGLPSVLIFPHDSTHGWGDPFELTLSR